MLAAAAGADTIPSCSHRAAESSYVGTRLGSWGQSSKAFLLPRHPQTSCRDPAGSELQLSPA